jgi:hypothetical protein
VTARPMAGSVRFGRLGRVAPVPFVGTAAILVALIVFTPVLLASGPSPLAVQGVLTVYRPLGGPTTDVGAHGVDAGTPYRWLNLSFGSGFRWDGSCPSSGLTWQYDNATNVTGVNRVTGANPVVLNATAVYVSSGVTTVYAGAVAVELVGQNTSSESLLFAACASTPGMGPPGSWAVSLGTLQIDLVNYGSRGPT